MRVAAVDRPFIFELSKEDLSVADPLLTIIVPTYNRARCLSLLLRTLAHQLKGLHGRVEVTIGDNASTDETPDVTHTFLQEWPSAKILRHSTNVGADENFCRCVDQVTTRYFWIIGDDDLPKCGVVPALISLLERQDADILYLNSEWRPVILNAADGEPFTKFNVQTLGRDAFARAINVWVTFISGMVVNRERLYALNPGLDIRRFAGTCLVQLGWVLPLLMSGSVFKICRKPCLLATSENTGGYSLFKVFGSNFPAILDAVCGPNSRVNLVISIQLRWVYIPRLIKGTRFGKIGAFPVEDISNSLVVFKGSLAYYLGMWPLIRLPHQLALMVYALLMLPTLTKRLIFKWFGVGGAI